MIIELILYSRDNSLRSGNSIDVDDHGVGIIPVSFNDRRKIKGKKFDINRNCITNKPKCSIMDSPIRNNCYNFTGHNLKKSEKWEICYINECNSFSLIKKAFLSEKTNLINSLVEGYFYSQNYMKIDIKSNKKVSSLILYSGEEALFWCLNKGVRYDIFDRIAQTYYKKAGMHFFWEESFIKNLGYISIEIKKRTIDVLFITSHSDILIERVNSTKNYFRTGLDVFEFMVKFDNLILPDYFFDFNLKLNNDQIDIDDILNLLKNDDGLKKLKLHIHLLNRVVFKHTLHTPEMRF